ncbi:MAG: 16S rRNA (uracil(1498)-N(3))-methyltransferase [Pirellulaceae bacterium]|mgnify:CR=1 FL=1|nr:16S rRNA (uracil(1498)-N(3))-methyltransferase [Pirellulaceae bacterium]
MSDRYFSDEPISGGQAELTGAEAHHLIHVMRAEPGVKVVLFDGGGDEFHAIVDRVGRDNVSLSVVSREQVDRELPLNVSLAVALPKGDRQRWLVEKAVELGVSRLVPVSVSRAVARPNEQTLMRLRRTVVEASKQCGRNRLMQIERPLAWPDFIDKTIGAPNRLLAHPGLETLHPAIDRERAECLLAVGPEGGFTEAEVSSALSAGWRGVDLGPRILRVETAAIIMASMVVWQYRL